jgi:hypothetical protein
MRHGTDKRGRAVYAYRGRQATYVLPKLAGSNGAAIPAPSAAVPAPLDPANSDNGAAVPAPSAAVPAPSAAVPAPSAAVPAPSAAVPAPFSSFPVLPRPYSSPPRPTGSPSSSGSAEVAHQRGMGGDAPHRGQANGYDAVAAGIVADWQRFPGAAALGIDGSGRVARAVADRLADGCTEAQIRDALRPALPETVHDVAALLSSRVGKISPRQPIAEHTASARPAWCGECDERTRLVESPTGAMFRCPRCHPVSVQGDS